MRKLGTIDLEVLQLAVNQNGTFNETHLENSKLKRHGVGKILDTLASLKDRKFISMNENGSFTITELAKEILWSSKIPIWAKILRLLQIKSCDLQQIIETINSSEDEIFNELEQLRKQLLDYDALKYWKFITMDSLQIQNIYNSLKSKGPLDNSYATDEVFIVDSELMQRGRTDDRTDNDIEKNTAIYGLSSYNCIEVAEIKNKMSEDLRILFTEYRQKRKGNFDSSSRRKQDIKKNEKD